MAESVICQNEDRSCVNLKKCQKIYGEKKSDQGENATVYLSRV